MFRACIAVVDASRARLFTFQRTRDEQGLREELIEERDLVNPARRLTPSEQFTESRPPLGRTGNLQYTIDDHRDGNIQQQDAEFSRVVVGELADLLNAAPTQRLIVCASPRMLGELRRAREELRTNGLDVHEVARDLVKLTPAQLRAQLASYGLLPEPPARAQLA